MARFTGKVAVVTGASKGIGAAIAKQFGAEGASVVVNYSSDKAGADRVVAEIEKSGSRAIAVGASVSKEAEVTKLIGETKKAFGKIDILVNNAGVYGFAPLEAITADEYRRQHETNVLGPLLVTQAALPLFPEAGGSVINISSVVNGIAPPQAAVYASTKGALDVITKSLAKELGPKKIRVNSINPGLTATEGTAANGIQNSEFEANTVKETPLGRVGLPEDIAGPTVFLASEEAAWITGETIYVSGGLGI